MTPLGMCTPRARRAIGAATINLIGVSYGTRVALEYLRRHPDRTRTVVLDGVVPPEIALGAETARNLDAALAARALDPSVVEAGLKAGEALDWEATLRELLSAP